MIKKLTFALLTVSISACQTVPTISEINSTAVSTFNSIQVTTKDTIETVNQKYQDTELSEKLSSENIQGTAQELLDYTQMNNFFTLPGSSEAARIKKAGYLIRASAGIWRDTAKGRKYNTYPGQLVIYDERIERTVQQRIAKMKRQDILSWKHPYWGALWIYNVTHSYGNSGEKCLHFEVGTPHRIMSVFPGQTACINNKTGVFEPQKIRYVDLLPREPIANFGPFKIPGERIDRWNL